MGGRPALLFGVPTIFALFDESFEVFFGSRPVRGMELGVMFGGNELNVAAVSDGV